MPLLVSVSSNALIFSRLSALRLRLLPRILPSGWFTCYDSDGYAFYDSDIGPIHPVYLSHFLPGTRS